MNFSTNAKTEATLQGRTLLAAFGKEASMHLEKLLQKSSPVQASAAQKAVQEAAQDPAQDIFVQARAGAGKSTTMRMIAGPGAEAATLHALGARTLTASGFRLRYETGAMVDIICDLLPLFRSRIAPSEEVAFLLGLKEDPAVEKRTTLVQVADQVASWVQGTSPLFRNLEPFSSRASALIRERFASQTSLEEETLASCADLCARLAMGALLEVEKKAKQGSLKKATFDMQIWLPVRLGLKPAKFSYDTICVDEAQDMSPAQLILARQLAKRLILVGDECQAIYGFRGASSEFFSSLAQGMRVCPLTVTYRCPARVVELARMIVPDLSCGNEKKGIVEEITHEKFLDMVKPGSFVLCRNNAPLARFAIKLLSQGIPVALAGKRNAQEEVMRICRKLFGKAVSSESWKDKILKYKDSQEALAHEKCKTEKGLEDRLEEIEDECQLVELFVDKALTEFGEVSLPSIELVVKDIFPDSYDPSKVILGSTVHRAKGLECERVFIIDGKSFTRDSEQSNFLRYVAITRSLNELYSVGFNFNLMPEYKKENV